MQIEYITHASLLFDDGKTRLLTDPFYFFEKLIASFICHYPHRDLSSDSFPQLDFVFCSHIHDDHCHKKTLFALQNKIDCILLPANQSRFEKKIHGYGFRNIAFLENEKTRLLPNGLKLTCFHDKNGVDTALIVEWHGKTFLHQNDCRLDVETFERMASRFKIDFAFVPHTGNQELFPLLLSLSDEDWLKLSREREDEGLSGFIESLKILKPQCVIPYSFTIAYHNHDQIKLNAYNRTTPVEFQKILKKEIPEIESLILQPGDILDENGTIQKYRDENLWGENLQEYAKNITAFAQNTFGQKSEFDFGSCTDVEAPLATYFSERLKESFPDIFANQAVELIIRGQNDESRYFIDTGDKTFAKTQGKFPFLTITMPASLVQAFLSREYDSFMILYSYRVTFQLGVFLGMTPEEECFFHIQAIMALFDYELYQEELAG
jgi:UDP-MurNAc hydroxylase